MRSPLTTDDAPYESAPCTRLRNGVPCNEPLDFNTTDGMGRILPRCPVCDWGWRPSREYGAFRKRFRTEPIPEPRPAHKRHCARCYEPFVAQYPNERLCSDACRAAARKDNVRRARQGMGSCATCGRHFPALTRQAKYCISCRGHAIAKSKRKYWQNKQLRGAA